MDYAKVAISITLDEEHRCRLDTLGEHGWEAVGFAVVGEYVIVLLKRPET